MMGQLDGGTAKLFYEFSLEEMVPQNHLLRKINLFLIFDDLRAHLEPFYSHTGRPSIDPELMIRMLIVGYCFAYVPSAGFARTYISIWRIAGFAS